MARYDLSGAEWRLIASQLPNEPRGAARVDDRRVINEQMGEGRRMAEGLRGAGSEVSAVDAVHHPGLPARCGWKNGGPDHAIGRSRGGLSTKIHAVVDQDGLPVRG